TRFSRDWSSDVCSSDLLLLVFGLAFLASARRRVGRSRLLLWMAVLTIPMPWLAAELGWFVAEVGRQPWTVSGVLPTWLSVSSLKVGRATCRERVQNRDV